MAQTFREKVVEAFKQGGGAGGPTRPSGEDKPAANPFQVDKTILLETATFEKSPLDAKKCCTILTKVLYLINSGQGLTAQQKTKLFFQITKLFQSSDLRLRRMVYLLVKTIEPSESEVFIITSSLTKDMNSRHDCYRANAIRVLSKIIDTSIATQIDRNLKTATVDENPFVASSALLCGLTLIRTAPDNVKRWVNEVQKTISSKHLMVQYHALTLLRELKGGDRLALQKVVQALTGSFLKSPLAECLLIRYATELLYDESDQVMQKVLLDYLEGCLRHRLEMVSLEAAKAFCDLAVFDSEGAGGSMVLGLRDIGPAVNTLKLYLSSQRSILRFAAVRQLNRLAQVRAHVVSRSNSELEALLSDSNRNISTMALTTLLKTGDKSSVDRLVKQISGLMGEISDPYKADIIRAVRQLSISYPEKHKVLMTFLSSNLREEGSFQHKSDIVDCLIFLSQKIPDAQELGLLQLCEFIEDCEYPALCTQILSFLGLQAPLTRNPSKYVRFIYNRLILENAQIRAAGVDALTKIASKCPELRNDTLLLLDCCLSDNDDEVRDRTALYCRSLKSSAAAKAGDEVDLLTGSDVESTASTAPSVKDLLDLSLPVSLDAVIESLEKCAQNDFDQSSLATFDVAALPTEDAYRKQKKEELAATGASSTAEGSEAAGAAKTSTLSPTIRTPGGSIQQRDIAGLVASLVAEDALGPLLHSTRASSLTEKEAEYTVTVFKHMYAKHVVLEFATSNTMQDQSLENVALDLKPDEATISVFEVTGCVPIKLLPYGPPNSAFVLLTKRPEALQASELGALVGNYSARLTFVMKESGDDLGYEDAFPIERVQITLADYCSPRPLRQGEFKQVWDTLETQGREKTAKLSLSFRSMKAAVAGLLQTLCLAACENSDNVEDPSKTNQVVLMSGTFVGGLQVLCKGMLVMSQEHGCLLKMVVRSKSEAVCKVVLRNFDEA